MAIRNPKLLGNNDGQCRVFWSLSGAYRGMENLQIAGKDLYTLRLKGILQDLMRSDFAPLSTKAELLLKEIQEKSLNGKIQPDTKTE